MRFLLVVTTAVFSLLSAGCELHQVKGEVAGVEVEAKTADANNKGDFCPPGQAKKGRC